MLKVSPKNNGSQHLVLGTEDLGPGDAIPRHKHLGQDEIVLVQSGVIHVHVGDQERDLHAGGMAFIPAFTWVSLKNNDTQPASMLLCSRRLGSRITCDAYRCRRMRNRLL